MLNVKNGYINDMQQTHRNIQDTQNKFSPLFIHVVSNETLGYYFCFSIDRSDVETHT